MPNESDVVGTITFHSSKKDPAAIKKIIDYKNQHWRYAKIELDDGHLDKDIANSPLKWGVPYPFTSTGRKTFRQSLTKFFDNFLHTDIQGTVNGVFIRFKYKDINWSDKHLEVGNILITSYKNKGPNEMETIISEQNITSLDFNAENLEKYEYSSKALDTFTDYGIKNFVEMMEDYAEGSTSDKNPTFEAIGRNIHKLSINELKEVFLDVGANEYVSDWVGESVIYEMFDEYDLENHPDIDKLIV